MQLCDMRQGLTSLCLRRNTNLLCRASARITWFGPSIPRNQLLLLEASLREGPPGQHQESGQWGGEQGAKGDQTGTSPAPAATDGCRVCGV